MLIARPLRDLGTHRLTRVLEPETLSGNAVFAWCHLRGDERAFHLGRMLAAEPSP
ncbi:MAG: hypothetical protein ACRDMV_01800 [Streptosporangiales bacterium]